MNVGSLFSGVGLLDYGLHLAGFRHAWGCEADEWRRGVWGQRFGGPCYPDIRGLRGADLVPVDVLAGGFPCKGASSAGKREGFGHPETVLWREMARVVGELRPRYVLIENVADILSIHDGAVWGEVLGDLATLGYDTEWDCLPAAAFGAPHRRDRVFAVAAHTSERGREASVEELRRGQPDADRCAVADPAGVGAGGPAGQADSFARGRDSRQEPVRGGPDLQVAPDSERERDRPEAGYQDERPRFDGPASGLGGRGVAVEWGDYEPAVRRWEAVHGAAPEPLVRRVDDRGAARVERSRLSALGDGVLVQAGQFMGERIVSRHE